MQKEHNGLGWMCWAKDITELMAKAVRGHLDCTAPDAVLNIETHLFNVTLVANSCDYGLDVGKELWLNRSRWSRLTREYVPKEPLDRFINQAVEVISGEARLGATANMMFNDPKRYEKKHRWGGCLMGATFRGDNNKSGPATLTFYSRTTYMGYMALLDAAIASCIAHRIWQKAYGPTVSDTGIIAFRWHISSQQLHCFKTLPYVYSQPDLFARIERYNKQRRSIDNAPPTWKHMAKWYFKVKDEWDRWRHRETIIGETSENDQINNQYAANNMLANEKYGPFKRIKRRWLEHQGYLLKHVPPSLKLDSLDFSKCEDVTDTDFNPEDICDEAI